MPTNHAEVSYEAVEGRGIAALLHPRPVYLVTSRGEDGSDNAASVAWVTPLSHRPPLVGLSVRPSSHTHALIGQTGHFVVNIVDTSMVDAVRACGNASGSTTDKIADAGLRLLPAEKIDCGRIQEALGWLECCVETRIDAGDHVLFIAAVVAASGAEGFTDGWDPSTQRVLQCAAHDRFGAYIDDGAATTPSEVLGVIRIAREADRAALDRLFAGEDMGGDYDTLEVIVYEVDGAIAGALRVELGDDAAWIRPVVVEEAYQMQGIGAILVRTALARHGSLSAVARGVAVPFYERMGFEPMSWEHVPWTMQAECGTCMDRDECLPLPMRRGVPAAASAAEHGET